jgi:hypothetical protein
MNLGNERKLEIERGSKRLHSLQNSLCKRLWSCHKTAAVAVAVAAAAAAVAVIPD